MAIKIQTKQTYIPIHLGDLELRFDVTDESISAFRKEALKIQKEMEKVAVSEDYDTALGQAKDALKQGLDTFFGKGSFDKVYEISPSVVIVMDYFTQMTEAIETELKKMGKGPTTQDKARKYLANKAALQSPLA